MFNSNPYSLAGFKIITNPLLVVDGEPQQVRRTWKERLLTRPWRPWVKYKTVIPKVPSTEVLGMGYNIIVHPVMADKIRNELMKNG